MRAQESGLASGTNQHISKGRTLKIASPLNTCQSLHRPLQIADNPNFSVQIVAKVVTFWSTDKKQGLAISR